MKKYLLSLLILSYGTQAYSGTLDSLEKYDQHRYAIMYHNLDHRLKEAELNMKISRTANEEGMLRIEMRLERMEDKFDKYFLWGYGTLLSIFIGVLAWMLNRFKIQQIVREPPPPSSDLKLSKQKYLYSS